MDEFRPRIWVWLSVKHGLYDVAVGLLSKMWKPFQVWWERLWNKMTWKKERWRRSFIRDVAKSRSVCWVFSTCWVTFLCLKRRVVCFFKRRRRRRRHSSQRRRDDKCQRRRASQFGRFGRFVAHFHSSCGRLYDESNVAVCAPFPFILPPGIGQPSSRPKVICLFSRPWRTDTAKI